MHKHQKLIKFDIMNKIISHISGFLRVIFISLFVLLSGAGFCQTESTGDHDLFFPGTYDEVLEQAKAHDKPVFIFAHTDWCGYCKKFRNYTLADSQIRESLKKNFINIQINMESEDGIRIARRYLINAYPTLLFVNPSSDEIFRVTGYQDIGPFLKSLSLARQQKVASVQPAE